MLKKCLKNRGLVPTIQPEPDFSWTCGFRQKLDNVELIMYMKFQKILMTGCRDMDKKHQKCPKNGGFPPLVTPQDFFSKIGLCHFCTLMVALTSCKKLENTNERSLRYVKTDQQTDGPGRLPWTPSVKPGVQNTLQNLAKPQATSRNHTIGLSI